MLNKPFADVAETIGLGKDFTQRGLRRTFNDLARAAQVEGIVTRSISGHLTERMQEHYSTVDGALAKVIRLVDALNVARGGEGVSAGVGRIRKKPAERMLKPAAFAYVF